MPQLYYCYSTSIIKATDIWSLGALFCWYQQNRPDQIKKHHIIFLCTLTPTKKNKMTVYYFFIWPSPNSLKKGRVPKNQMCVALLAMQMQYDLLYWNLKSPNRKNNQCRNVGTKFPMMRTLACTSLNVGYCIYCCLREWSLFMAGGGANKGAKVWVQIYTAPPLP